jgi:hypothetical protein
MVQSEKSYFAAVASRSCNWANRFVVPGFPLLMPYQRACSLLCGGSTLKRLPASCRRLANLNLRQDSRMQVCFRSLPTEPEVRAEAALAVQLATKAALMRINGNRIGRWAGFRRNPARNIAMLRPLILVGCLLAAPALAETAVLTIAQDRYEAGEAVRFDGPAVSDLFLAGIARCRKRLMHCLSIWVQSCVLLRAQISLDERFVNKFTELKESWWLV